MKAMQGKTVGLALLGLAGLGWADEVQTYREIKDWTPYFGGEVGTPYLAGSFEYSSVHLSQNHQVDWYESDVQLSLPLKGATPYFDVAYYQRDGVGDYALTAGSYFKLGPDTLQVEAGAGLNVDFIYQFQSTVEYQYRLANNLYGKIRARYMRYDTAGDVWVGSPVGLIYYFGDNYVTADYDCSSTAGRGTAQWGSVKADFTVNPRWGLYTGAAVGERLFDMSELPASLENGYILFAGVRFRLLKDAQLTTGISYSEEQPTFIQRSIDVSLSIKL
jgi:YaiO family outer membrane protein